MCIKKWLGKYIATYEIGHLSSSFMNGMENIERGARFEQKIKFRNRFGDFPTQYVTEARS